MAADPTAYLTNLQQQALGIDDERIPLKNLREALSGPRVVITGAGGVGKTTLLKYIASLLASGLLDARTWTLLFPVWIPLAEVRDGESWAAYLGRRSEALDWGLPGEYFREKLESGAAILLIDEVTDRHAMAVEEAARRWPASRVVAAARAGACRKLAGYETIVIATINP